MNMHGNSPQAESDIPQVAKLEKDVLLSMYQEATSNAKWVADKIWTNTRFFTSLTSALISLTVVTVVAVVKDKPTAMSSPFVLLLVILPVLVITLSFLGIANLKREYSRFLDWVAVISKLQEKLGLYQSLRFNVFPKDKFLLPERFVKHDFASSDEFLLSAMSKKSSVYRYFYLLHWIYVSVSFFALGVIVVMYLCL